jgi:hypothetical protein
MQTIDNLYETNEDIGPAEHMVEEWCDHVDAICDGVERFGISYDTDRLAHTRRERNMWNTFGR